MSFFLSLAAAFLFGAGDFVGGLTARHRASPLRVAVASQWVGLALLVPLFWVLGDRPDPASLMWGAFSGISTGVGLVFLFRALSAGTMAIGAALAGIFTAALPVLFGLLTGERPVPIAMLGLVLAVGSIVPIIHDPPTGAVRHPDEFRRWSAERVRRGGAMDGLVAGVGWGATSIFLAQTPIAGGLWPLASAQTATVVILTAITLGSGNSVTPPRDAVLPSAAVAVFHISGTALFLLALQRGLLSLVAVVQSLYPAVTIVLARLALQERLAPRQIVGLLTAAVGVTFIGLG